MMEAASEMSTTASGSKGKKFGYLPIPPVECTEHWEEIKHILIEASPASLFEFHKLIHTVMKERNIPIPVIDGK